MAKRDEFIELIGLSGIEIPATYFMTANPRDERLQELNEFSKTCGIRFPCETVEDYLFYTQYSYDNFGTLLYKDPYGKEVGVSVNFEVKLQKGLWRTIKRTFLGGKEEENDFGAPKIICVGLWIVNQWIKDHNLEDSAFRSRVQMPAPESDLQGKLNSMVRDQLTYTDEETGEVRSVMDGLPEITRKPRVSKIYRSQSAKAKAIKRVGSK